VNYRVLLTATLLLFLVGCGATPYQEMGTFNATGGYKTEQASNGIIKIVFNANSRLKPSMTKTYTMLRAAEVGKDRGKPYFAMYASMVDALTDQKKSDEPVLETTIFGTQVVGSQGYAFVKYHNVKQPGDLSVDKIYKQYGHFIQGDKGS